MYGDDTHRSGNTKISIWMERYVLGCGIELQVSDRLLSYPAPKPDRAIAATNNKHRSSIQLTRSKCINPLLHLRNSIIKLGHVGCVPDADDAVIVSGEGDQPTAGRTQR